MSRKGHIQPRTAAADPRFQSVSVSKFINHLMQRGKRSTASSLVYKSLELIEQRAKKGGLEVFEAALRNASPVLEVRPRRVGGATYQIPMEIRQERRQTLAVRWLIQAARARPGKSMVEKLAGELMDAASGQGATMKKKEEVHRLAESNKAFAHYRW